MYFHLAEFFFHKLQLALLHVLCCSLIKMDLTIVDLEFLTYEQFKHFLKFIFNKLNVKKRYNICLHANKHSFCMSLRFPYMQHSLLINFNSFSLSNNFFAPSWNEHFHNYHTRIHKFLFNVFIKLFSSLYDNLYLHLVFQ